MRERDVGRQTQTGIVAKGWPGAEVYVDGVLGTALDTSFHHVVITGASDVDFSAFQLGGVSAEGLPFAGKLDDVRLFTESLSASDVSTLFAKPYCGL